MVMGFQASGERLEVLADWVIQSDLALLDEQHDSGGNELLADRRNLVDGFRRGRHLEVDVRDAVARALDNLTFLEHHEREAWDVLPLHFVLDEDVCPVRLRKKDRGKEHHKTEQHEMSVSHDSLACPGQRMGA